VQELVADCARCSGLCCVVPAFARSADFAIDKPARTPCPNLRADHRCGVHDRLPELGFRGCTVYDCFGAGQQVTQVTFGGRDHRQAPGALDVFETMRALHELLWYLTQADERVPGAAGVLRAQLLDLTGQDAARLAGLDVRPWYGRTDAVLSAVSAQVRTPPGPDHRRADLAGRDLRRAGLRDADLRGSVLIGADLRGVDLGRADLLGADLRGADLRGADLGAALFVTRSQLAAARLDARTRTPPSPDHRIGGGPAG
jgi:uncharacterized protein YjbI with pentapeptide repeats